MYHFWHCSKVKSFQGEELPEDVDHVKVLGIYCILLELHDVLPVLQGDPNLGKKKKKCVGAVL